MLNLQNLGLRPRERREEFCVMNIVFVVGCCLFIELTAFWICLYHFIDLTVLKIFLYGAWSPHAARELHIPLLIKSTNEKMKTRHTYKGWKLYIVNNK